MQLRYSQGSPFVRKVLVFAHEAGLAGQIELVPAAVWEPDSDIAKDNPLGRIPALVTDDGVFIGSLLCCEYLDTRHGGAPLIPKPGPARWREMGVHALADGMMDATVAIVAELLHRPLELIYPGFLARQREKIERALVALNGLDVEALDPGRIGAITLGCALAYLDYRLGDLEWRARHAALAAFMAQYVQRPAMRATKAPPPAPVG